MAYRLYLPEGWAQDSERREPAGVPERIRFQTKPENALESIRQAVETDVTCGVALALPASAWKDVAWREGTQRTLRSRLAALRVRPAHRDYWKAEPDPEEWLLIEWLREESEPTKYWVSTLPARTRLKALVKLAKHRWIIERDYEELKQELGLGHYEGCGWRGFHHHATLCIAACGFLVSERNRFSPAARAGRAA
jgi:SRSO17 transposase